MKFAVFVSGPYSGDTKANIKKAMDVADKIINLGGLPLVPHLWYYMDKQHGRDYETWFNLALDLLDRADCLYRMPGESPGADKEVQKAQELSIPIFYSLEDLEDAFKFGGV
jgi:hypothetical protein